MGALHATGGYFQTKSRICPPFYILCSIWCIYAQLTTPLFMCLKCGTGPGRSEQHIIHMLVKIAAAVHTLDATDFKLSHCFDDHFWQNAKMVT